MWVLFAFLSAVFAGVTSIFAKIGLQKVDSYLATALRTVVVLIFAIAVVFIVGSQNDIGNISTQSWFFLIISGLATGASWLCYFKALQIGSINKVVSVDKSSTVLTMLLALIFLAEVWTVGKIVSMVAILAGTFMMAGFWQKNTVATQKAANKERSWFFYAILAAVFASLTAIFSKIGIEGVESNLGTAIRVVVVLVMSWVFVFSLRRQGTIKTMSCKNWWFILLSGLATGASWLFFFAALQQGEASIVVPIDKLSIVITVVFAYWAFKEKLTLLALLGLLLIVLGTIILPLGF
ncbi:MAG: EamA family transporter [Chloroflexi bacterium]|nr:EamA family transporter [Chloroflexota bacterium]